MRPSAHVELVAFDQTYRLPDSDGRISQVLRKLRRLEAG